MMHQTQQSQQPPLLFSLLSPDDLARAAQTWGSANPRGFTHLTTYDAAAFMAGSGLPREI